MEFRILGPLEIADGDRVVHLGAGKQRALLAVLLLHANEVVASERLIEDLWGDAAPATAAKSVQVYVSQVRKALRNGAPQDQGERVLLTRAGGYVVALDRGQLDVHRLERSLEDGRRALDGEQPERAAKCLRDGLALWRGPPLADFRYEPFAQSAILRLEELRLAVLEERIEADLELGRHGPLVGELELLTGENPLRERLRGQLMVALYRCGRQAQALEVYRAARATLVEELGLEPGPQLRHLEQSILAQSPDLAAPASDRRAPAAATAVARPPPRRPERARFDRLARARRSLHVAGAVALLAAIGAAVHELASPAAPATRIDAPLRFNALAAVDARTGAITAAVPVPGRLGRVAAGAGSVWVGSDDARTVTAVDRRSDRMTRTIPTGVYPGDIAAGGGAVWVVDGHGDVLVKIHPGYGRVTDRVALGRPASDRVPPADRFAADPTSVAVGAGGVWVTDGARRLVRIDPASARIVATVDAGRPLSGVDVGPDAVWAIGTPAVALRIDPATNRITDRIPIARRAGGDAPRAIAIAVGAGFVWVLEANTATVTKIDPRTRAVVQTTRVGVDRSPVQIAAGSDAAWVADDDGTLSRIDAHTGALEAVPVGHGLRDVAVAGDSVWVANQLTRCCGQE